MHKKYNISYIEKSFFNISKSHFGQSDIYIQV